MLNKPNHHMELYVEPYLFMLIWRDCFTYIGFYPTIDFDNYDLLFEDGKGPTKEICEWVFESMEKFGIFKWVPNDVPNKKQNKLKPLSCTD